MSHLLEPLQYPFMRDALLAGGLVAVVCAFLSCFLILKGWSLMGDAISHAVLPGIVLAYLCKLPLALGAFAAGLFCATSTGFIKRNSRVKEDTVMGVVFTGMFAVGLVMFSKTTSELHLDHILVGSILGITPEQMRQTLILGGVVLLILFVLRRDLLLICFDPAHANVLGLRARLLNYVLLSLLALAVVVSLQTVGIILVVAMLVTPGCIAHLWTDRFDRMLIISTSTALLATLVGVLSSYFLEASTGACIVLTQALVFFGSLMFAPKYGLLGKKRRLAARS